jgi:hypothetical protein
MSTFLKFELRDVSDACGDDAKQSESKHSEMHSRSGGAIVQLKLLLAPGHVPFAPPDPAPLPDWHVHQSLFLASKSAWICYHPLRAGRAASDTPPAIPLSGT